MEQDREIARDFGHQEYENYYGKIVNKEYENCYDKIVNKEYENVMVRL